MKCSHTDAVMQFSVQMARRVLVKWKIPVIDVGVGWTFALCVKLIALKCIYCIGGTSTLVINKTVFSWCDF